uniref:Cytochrome c biogenesis protein CcsB n=1 Tax=Sphondylothamnion multifidum TaxID=193186 RepID=A0A4D6X1X0_9FLOR|nr:cytochrome c biogenesis protein ccs1 [Sphondylothamnion multifidum]
MRLSKIKNSFWHLLKRLANLNFAIFLLFLIVFLSMLGSIIEQDQNLLFYQSNYPIQNNILFFFNWRIIIYLGLDHLYQSWLFLLILSVFSISLVTCTFSLQLPSLKNARRWKFINIKKQSIQYNLYDPYLSSHQLIKNSLVNIIYALNNSSFYVFQKGSRIYAYKGLIGRIAPIFVHMSIILILIGSVIGAFGGFMLQEMVTSGEIFHFKNVISAGIFSSIPRKFLGYVNDFRISYNNDGSIKQFFCKVFILDNKGSILQNKTIAVNLPLFYKGLTFYQTDWNIDGLRIKFGESMIIQKKLQQINLNNKKCWLCNIKLNENKQYLLLLLNSMDFIYIYDKSLDQIFSLNLYQPIFLDGIKISIVDVIVSTGLQVKSDPGIIIVYLGFLGIMLSTLASYISYTQIWISLDNNIMLFSGITNRAILFFEEDISSINLMYQKYTL